MPPTTLHNVGFPVYSVQFGGPSSGSSKEAESKSTTVEKWQLVLSGGGGNSKTGVRNKLVLYELDVADRAIAQKAEHLFEKDEDAPMTISVHPDHQRLVAAVNADPDAIKRGENRNLRSFDLSADSLTFKSGRNALSSDDSEHYTRTSAFSPDGKHLALGNTNGQFWHLSYPDVEEVSAPRDFANEIYDVDFSEDSSLVLAASTNSLVVFSTDSSTAEPVQTIEKPLFQSNLPCTFRAARFGRGKTADRLFTVVNAKGQGRNGKRSLVSMWQTKAAGTGNWTLTKTRQASPKQVTAFAVSDDGRFLAVGTADYSITVLEAETLKTLLHVLQAHDLPPTAIRFSPAGDLIVSASADGSVRVTTVKPDLPRRRSALQTAAIALLILLFALLVQYFLANRVDPLKAAESLKF